LYNLSIYVGNRIAEHFASMKTLHRMLETIFGKLESRSNLVLSCILLFSFIVKLLLWINVLNTNLDLFTWGDTKAYHDTAVAVHRVGAFSMTADDPTDPQTYRTPGYPAFLAAIYTIFGERWSAAVMVQILISLLTIFITYHIARKLWDDRVALLAALIVSLETATLIYTLKIMTETLFTFLLVFMIYAGIKAIENRRKFTWLLLCGISLAAATSVRPISYYLLIPLALFFLWVSIRNKWRWQTILICQLLILLPSILFVCAWKQRNERMSGSSVYTSIEGFYALFWQGAAIIAERDGISLEEAQDRLGIGQDEKKEKRGRGYQRMHPETADFTFEQLSELWLRDGEKIILQHPFLFAKIYVTGIIRMFIRPGIHQLVQMVLGESFDESFTASKRYAHALIPFTIYAWTFLVFLYFGVLRFLWHTFHRRSWTHNLLLLLLILLYIVALSGGPSINSRFRIPIVPILAMFSAAGWLFSRQTHVENPQN
jgi:4-amino-4-deoxy-L-arabinose transferase-like glycosyltransferase